MYELRNADTGEVLATDKSYTDIMDTAGFYIGRMSVELWHDGEFCEDV